MLYAIYSDQVSVVSVHSGKTKQIRIARMRTRHPKENQFICKERKPKKEKMTLKEWERLQVSYAYFRYR